ncbi:hypothetical protein MDA_GLEAN10020455 [Myotis davidii]|uniref:Uncharacterized protein n=1 Tax=Myotis davidii TaxID=225400 RepID=L5LG77_MYODS|nr:hypothetical protein MDA_GLEAN10020455 [Myotis davidii]
MEAGGTPTTAAALTSREPGSGLLAEQCSPCGSTLTTRGQPLLERLPLVIDIHLINGEHIEPFHEDLTFTQDTLASPDLPKIADDLKDLPSGSRTYRLEDLAYTRSGDKGNSANIGDEKG